MWRQTAVPLWLPLLAVLNGIAAATTSAVTRPATTPSPHLQMESMQRTLDSLTSALAELQRDNQQLRRALTEVQTAVIRHTASSPCNGLTSPAPPRNTSGGGATYIRWGRTSCPPQTERLYRGYAGGSESIVPGAATDYLCLPEDPEYDSHLYTTDHAGLFGAEYQTNGKLFNRENHDVPCAVCRSLTRSTAIMIPAKKSCYPGLHLEYHGYLMAGHWNHTAGSQYVCVDINPESVPGSLSHEKRAKFFYFTVTVCGSLKCPPYREVWEATCVVCSK